MRWWLVVVALLVAGCASRVAVDYREQTDFAAYRTFALAPASGEQSLDDERVREVLRRLLPEEGLREAPAAEADLLVRHRFAGTTERRGSNVFWGLGTGIGRSGLGLGVSTPVGAREHTRLELVLELVDRGERQIVWQAESQHPLDANAAADRRREWIRETVTRMLEQYPPPGD